MISITEFVKQSFFGHKGTGLTAVQGNACTFSQYFLTVEAINIIDFSDDAGSKSFGDSRNGSQGLWDYLKYSRY